MGEGRCVYRVLMGKPEGKRPLGRPRCRWEYNIKIDLQEVGCGGMVWIGLAQDSGYFSSHNFHVQYPTFSTAVTFHSYSPMKKEQTVFRNVGI
jgi:hypothetical protein